MPPRKKKGRWISCLVLLVLGGVLAFAAVFIAMNYEQWMDTPGGSSPSLEVDPAFLAEPPLPGVLPWNTPAQTHFKETYLPKDQIKKLWDQGFYITSVDYDGSGWMVVMSKGTPYQEQAYLSGPEIQKTEIQNYWDKGYAITNFTYGSGTWLTVMSKGWPSAEEQAWLTGDRFPQGEIKAWWDKGFRITETAYGDDFCIVVLSKGSGIGAQAFRVKASVDDLFIEADMLRSQGLAMQSLDVSPWECSAVFSEGLTGTDQYHAATVDFPSGEIKKKWNEGYRIVDLSHGDGLWAIIMSKF